MASTFEYSYAFARFYDIIYHQIRDSVDHDYFLNVINDTKGNVLEIGVGTGRFFTSALTAGADIYGIDISKSMIDVLRKKLDPKEHYRLTIGDATTMKLNKKFNLILAPFRVFSHIMDVDDQIKFLNNVWSHLKNDGKFIFDLFIPNPVLLHNGMHDVVDFEGEYEPGKKLRRTVTSVPDIVNQILDITMNIEWEEDNKWHNDVWNFKMRFYFRYELQHLIKLSKLKLLQIYGDYNKNALTKDSKEFVIICSK